MITPDQLVELLETLGDDSDEGVHEIVFAALPDVDVRDRMRIRTAIAHLLDRLACDCPCGVVIE